MFGKKYEQKVSMRCAENCEIMENQFCVCIISKRDCDMLMALILCRKSATSIALGLYITIAYLTSIGPGSIYQLDCKDCCCRTEAIPWSDNLLMFNTNELLNQTKMNRI